ncbi:hypothetical protein C5167_027329 [Papaver somniferum]|nr:hypothetical protein C5167_027329 [Papaver somniferum]
MKLEDDDIPMLRKDERAETCYLLFMENFKKQKQTKPSIFRALALCYWEDILISGFFAVLKVLTLSTTPLFVGAFIKVTEGMGSFKHEALCNGPLAKSQLRFQTKLAVAQDRRLKAMSEALLNMKVLKLYAWETHFKTVIIRLRRVEYKWLSALQLRKAYNGFFFWSALVLVSSATFVACYFLKVPLSATNVFTFIATLRIIQSSMRSIPQVIGAVIHAKDALQRIAKFLAEPELLGRDIRHARIEKPQNNHAIHVKLATFSWEENPLKPTLTSINLEVKPGEKVAICGEVGAGKSTLLAAILGEVPVVEGSIQVQGKLTYVSQTAWIQSGSIQQNILFGRTMDEPKYQETLEKCSLIKDLEMLPYGDLTEIGERGINLSGGQKQRIQLARALYQDADIYLLDDPFSAVDALTATSLINEYIMGALSGKTVLLVTHQVDFLPTFDSVLLMSHGKIQQAGSFDMLMSSSQEFSDLANAHKDTVNCNRLTFQVAMGIHSSKSLFYKLLKSLFHAPISFYESTPLGRILSRVSSDSSIIDLDVPFSLVFAIATTLNTYTSLGVMAVITWKVLFVTVPMVCLVIYLQRYYSASANELMRINGTTKSSVASQLGESIAGAMTIRAFREEDRFFAESLRLIDKYASPSFHIFSTSQWLLQRLEILSATVLSGSALVMVLLPQGTFSSGFIGMALAYGLSLSSSLGNRPRPNWPTAGRALLRKSQILVLDEATASIDNATDCILQKIIRTEFAKCTVITVAHRIPTVMDSTLVLAISDGKIIQYDEPMKLITEEGSLFGQLVNEYWSHCHSDRAPEPKRNGTGQGWDMASPGTGQGTG